MADPFDAWISTEYLLSGVAIRETEFARKAWQAAIKHERDACAKVCDEARPSREDPLQYLAAKACAQKLADAIRSRMDA